MAKQVNLTDVEKSIKREMEIKPILGDSVPIPVREYSLSIGIFDKAHPVSRINIFPFTHKEVPREPVRVCLYTHWTLEFIRDASSEVIGNIVKSMIKDIDEEKGKIEKDGIF